MNWKTQAASHSSLIIPHSSFALEKRGLILQVFRLDRGQAEQALELVGAGGGVTLVEVAEVGEDPGHALAQTLDGGGPLVEVRVARARDLVEAREVARAHPADVGKVRRLDERRGCAPDALARGPRPLDERERDVRVARERREQVLLEPERVAQ